MFKTILNSRLRNPLLLVTAIVAATLISMVMEENDVDETNFAMAYLLSVVFVACVTTEYLYSIAASIFSILVFDFFFVMPTFSFQIYRHDNVVTFAIMLLVALIASSMTSRIKTLKQQSENRERQLRFLNKNIRNLMFVENFEQIAEIASKDAAQFLDASVMTAVVGAGDTLKFKSIAGDYRFDKLEDEIACLNAIRSCTVNEPAASRFFSNAKSYFLPVCGNNGPSGAIGVSFRGERPVPDDLKAFLDTLATQVSLALERERLRVRQEHARIGMEKERMRTSLLRGISHDLRTPLTGILGSANALLEHFAVLGDDVKLGFIKDIAGEAEWLGRMVENTLYMTKLDDDGMQLNIETLPVEELVAPAVERMKKRAKGANIVVEMPRDLIMVRADATLILQVLINLLDNAVRYSPGGACVLLRVAVVGSDVIFEVSDSGPGIPDDEMSLIFNRYFVSARNPAAQGRQKGVGLGLSICKTIMDAHGGKIEAENNPEGGATLRFTLPLEKA